MYYPIVHGTLSDFIVFSTLTLSCARRPERLTLTRKLKEKYPELDVMPVDSLAATGGMGILIEQALKNREAGMSLQENYKVLTSLVPKGRNWFLVQDLNYLKRGGRISSTTAIFGSMLNIKPILKIDENGKLTTIAKKRGNKMAVQALFELFKEHYDEQITDTIYLCDADCKELSTLLAEELHKTFPNLEIKQTTLCPIIGAHTGPGMLAILSFRKVNKKPYFCRKVKAFFCIFLLLFKKCITKS